MTQATKTVRKQKDKCNHRWRFKEELTNTSEIWVNLFYCEKCLAFEVKVTELTKREAIKKVFKLNSKSK